MRLDKLVKTTVDALEDIKGRDIVVLDVRRMTALFDKVIVVSGDSTRQNKALANHVQEKAKAMLAAHNEKAKAVKTSTATDDVKKTQLEAIYKEKDEQLKSILGEDKYSIFKATQKAQKEAAKVAAPAQ